MSTTILGAGLQPAGTSPAGVGLPGSLDTIVATRVVVRGIDPVTGDYAYADDGLSFAAISATEQRVLLALGTVPGSVSFDETFGNDALTLKRDDGKLARTVADACTRALAQVVKEGAVAIVSTTVLGVDRGVLAFECAWTDLATNQTTTTRVP